MGTYRLLNIGQALDDLLYQMNNEEHYTSGEYKFFMNKDRIAP